MIARPPARRIVVVLVCCLAGFAAGARAGSQPPRADAERAVPVAPPGAAGRLTLTTERVVVFKDGYALIVKSATGALDAQGQAYTDEVPDSAVLGSFWATAEKEPIKAMRAEWITDKRERASTTACIAMVELLRANKGRVATLELPWGSKGEGQSLSGTIVEVLDMPPPLAETGSEGTGAPGQPSGRGGAGAPEAARGESVREIVPRGGVFVVVESADAKTGRVIVAVDQVRSISGPGLVTTMSRREMVTTRTKRLSFEFAPGAAEHQARVRIMYFTPGVRWIPTYRLTGELKDSGQVSLQAELLNELEDIDGAALDLVVGVPNFRFRTTISPLSLEAVLHNALLQAAPGLMGGQAQQYSNALFSQRAGEWQNDTGGGGGGPGGVSLAPELAAAGEQDLFVYSAPKLRLKKGSRAVVGLWDAQVPVKHLYTMDIKVVRNPNNAGPMEYQCFDTKLGALNERTVASGPASPLKLGQQFVWHELELTNTTDVPWTTGPALLMRESLPLGQDLLTYTSVKGKTLVPVTVAMDVRGTYKEEEIERKAGALEWNFSSDRYAMIRKRATITLTNNRAEATNTRVSLAIGGRADKASDAGAVTLNDFRTDDWGNDGLYRPNNHSDVKWDLSMDPGQTKVLTVEFVLYVK